MSRFLEELRKHKEDRGMMASLRCALVKSKKHRAWPVLSRLGADVTNREVAIIAGLYATHPQEEPKDNFGATCKVIQARRGEQISKDNKLTSTERRFMHLLAAQKGDELYDRVTRMVLMAKSQSVPINYELLEIDLRFWNSRTKRNWAASFWTREVDTEAVSTTATRGEL